MAEQNGKTSTGLSANAAGALCYLLGWITGLVFLVLEPANKFVRFHAIQSIIVWAGYTVILAIFIWLPGVGAILTWIAVVIGFILWIVLMLNAFQGRKLKMPVAGNIAESQSRG